MKIDLWDPYGKCNVFRASCILTALYNAATPVDSNGTSDIMFEIAYMWLRSTPGWRFYKKCGRILDVDLSTPLFDASGYDAHNGGTGTAEKVLKNAGLI